MNASPLLGRRVLVTRARDDAARWAERLAARGATPVVLPCVVIEPIDPGVARQALADALRDASWLVLSSARGATIAAALLDGRVPERLGIAAVGEATARSARAHLGRVDLVAAVATSAGLGRELAQRVAADGDARAHHIVVAGALGGRTEGEQALRATGATVTRVDLYRTVAVPAAAVKQDLALDDIHDVLLASPTAVAGLLNIARIPDRARVITIGPTTSAAARDTGLTVSAEARRPTFEAMLEAMS